MERPTTTLDDTIRLDRAALETAPAEAVAAQICAKLTAAFAPTALSLVDESHLHAGHGGWREGGATHFKLEITAPSLADKSRVARQRAVYAALADELATRVHALSTTIRAEVETS